MTHSPLAMKRRHVLGDIYDRCEHVENIPVYLDTKAGEPVGYADESLGHFADAFLFHLPELVCKKLSTGHFDYIFDYEYVRRTAGSSGRRRIRLNGILLIPKRKTPEDSPVGAIRSMPQ
jgi:hypothetical protein